MGRKPEFTQEFRDNAVKLIVVNGMAYPVVAKQLGISVLKLRSWVHKWRREKSLASQTSQESYLDELIELREQNAELREAVEILKKLRRTLRKTCRKVRLDRPEQAAFQSSRSL